MEVSIMSKTPDMVDVISRSAGICYGKDDKSIRRLRNCYKVGHTGVFEHASVSFMVRGISRACSHQLVRHRMASYAQESQRYNKYDLVGDDWYVVPPSVVEAGEEVGFRAETEKQAKAYHRLLTKGVKPEDARYLLPEAMKTSIVVTRNIRDLFHFFDLRLGPRAQWEIRELAEQMAICMENEEPELMAVYYEFREQTRID